MHEITVYTKEHCSYCVKAKVLLQGRGYSFREISLDEHPELIPDVMAQSGQRTVPQIFAGEQSIGGFAELSQKVASGEFDALFRK